MLLLALAASSASHANAEHGWEFGAVLDAGMSSKPLAVGTRDQGLQFGATRQAKRSLFFEHRQQQGELLTQLSVRIRQQLRQHAQ
jgi:hypothetical protein